MEKYASEEDKKTLVYFDPVDLTKQVESLQKEINTLHLEKLGARTDVSKLDNKATQFEFTYFNFAEQLLLIIFKYTGSY